MKLYLAYRFTWEVYEELVSTMTRVVAICQSLGIETFCSVLLEHEWREKGMSYDEILEICCKEIDHCDAMLALIWSDQESNGMRVELERLQALEKPLFLVIREGLDFWNFRSYASGVVEYSGDGLYDGVFKVLWM